MSVIYDLRYQLNNYKGIGTLEMMFPLLNFEISISRDHKTGRISSEDGCRLSFLGNRGSQYDIVTRIHPVNGYTELWTKEVIIISLKPANEQKTEWKYAFICFSDEEKFSAPEGYDALV